MKTMTKDTEKLIYSRSITSHDMGPPMSTGVGDYR